MKPPHDPPRLLDPESNAPAWLRSPLEAGARDVGSPERLARIAARLPCGPIGHVSSHTPDPSPDPSSPIQPPTALPAVPSVLSGAVVGAALGIAVVGAGWVASPRAAAPQPARPVPSATVIHAAPEPLRLGPAKTPAPRPRLPSERPEPLPSATAAPATPVELEPAGAAVAGPGPDPSAAESESTILLRAQDALRGSPARALALTDLHLAHFPGGALAQEREVLAISALLGMGRAADARARATRFVTSYPASADRRRLEVLIPDLESSVGVHKDSSVRPSTP